MKCPACETDVPSGRSACEHCGAPFPSVGEPPGPPPRFASGSAKKRSRSPNPKTEPLPMPAWDADDERPSWDAFAERPAPDVIPGAVPPGRHPAGWDAPGGWDSPAGWDAPAAPPATPPAGPGSWNPETPWAGPGTAAPPAGPDPDGWGPGVPPYAADHAAFPAEDRPAGKRKTPLLVAGVAVVVVLAGGLAYALTNGSANPPAGSAAQPAADSAAQQAAAADRLLGTGKTAHGHLPSPLRTCDDVAAGVSGFQQVVRDRQQELSQAMNLRVDRLQGGARLRTAMIAAYRNSLAADRAYLAWAQDVQARGCGGRIAPQTPHYRDAVAADNKAGPAKRRVAGLWKPIATSHGLTVYAWNSL